MERVYKITGDEALFHYCSATTFQAIATSKTIRFTDINMLNDESEVRWAYSIFEEAATRLIKRSRLEGIGPILDVDFIDKIDKIISPIQLYAHPFVACFSRKYDHLGQWRGYADDGRGFAIGFNAALLARQLPATFLRVLYDKEKQVEEMMAAISAIYLENNDGGDVKESRFFGDCVLLATYMTAFKHPAFEDEQEVRAVHVVNINKQGDLIKFIDNGGYVDQKTKVDGSPVSFQVRDNHLVAYLDITFTPEEKSPPISQLVLGPKNYSHVGNLSLFLGGLGYPTVALHKSVVPYR